MLGGTQSLHTNAADEALALPTEESARLALRTQQVIAYETGVPEVPDPLGGSVYVEELTDKIEAEARAYIERIDALGGTLASIESGWMQAEIQNAAYEYQRSIESGERIVVGVNKFQVDEDVSPPILKIDPATEKAQIERLREVRASRSASEAEAKLNRLEAAARGSENLMPRIVDACAAMCTVGEISDRLRRVFGEHREAG